MSTDSEFRAIKAWWVVLPVVLMLLTFIWASDRALGRGSARFTQSPVSAEPGTATGAVAKWCQAPESAIAL